MTWTSWRTGKACTPSPANACWGWSRCFPGKKPDLVLVHGDTSTTFSGALAAFYQKIAVGHVEAGLRTWDRYSPFPEEMNRTLVGDLATLHFCPTPANRENLLQEGIRDGIFVTGNTVIDALKTTVQPAYRFRTDLLNTLDYAGKRVILVTCHRRENYGQPMENHHGRPAPPGGRFSRRWNWSIPCTCLRRSRRWPGGTSRTTNGSI